MFDLMLKVLRFIGRHLHFRGRERLLRFFVHPDGEIDYPFEVDFFGFRYRGNLNVYSDWNVFFYGAYARYELLLIRDVLTSIRAHTGSPITCYDIGANVGQHSLFMSNIADAVYGFEPYAKVRDVARERLALNDVENVTLFPFGLGEEDETRRFIAPEGANMGTGKFVPGPAGNDGTSGAALEIKRGDKFVSEQGLPAASFIKIDAEGFEPQVFAGLEEVFRRDQPVVLAETLQDAQAGFGDFAGLKKCFDGARFFSIEPAAWRDGYRIVELTDSFGFETLIVPPKHAGIIRDFLSPEDR
jgi:FkbM family methyltransferase